MILKLITTIYFYNYKESHIYAPIKTAHLYDYQLVFESTFLIMNSNSYQYRYLQII